MNLSEKNRKNIISRWNKFHQKTIDFIEQNKHKNLHLLARICGYLAGDGNILVSNGKTCFHNTIRFFPDCVSLIDSFSEALLLVYDKAPKIKKYENYYFITLDSKPVVEDLISYGKFGTLDWEIPSFVLEKDEFKIEWIKAFFDCEAHVTEKQIMVKSVNSFGLARISDTLNGFGISNRIYAYQPKNPNWNKVHCLVIYRKGARHKYFNVIGFNHTKKLKKLGKSLNLAPRSRNLVSHKTS